MYVLKFGSLYLTANGTLSGQQSQALRVEDDFGNAIKAAAPSLGPTGAQAILRPVHLKART